VTRFTSHKGWVDLRWGYIKYRHGENGIQVRCSFQRRGNFQHSPLPRRESFLSRTRRNGRVEWEVSHEGNCPVSDVVLRLGFWKCLRKYELLSVNLGRTVMEE